MVGILGGTMVGILPGYMPALPWWPYYPVVYTPPTYPGYTILHSWTAPVRASAPAHAEVSRGNSLGSERKKPLGESLSPS